MTISKLTDLLNFGEWTQNDINKVRLLSDAESSEFEALLTDGFGELSQIDHVNLVLTYKYTIKQLNKALGDCFENAIAPLGAGITIKPDKDSEDFATKIFHLLQVQR